MSVIWNDNPKEYSDLENESRIIHLHPFLRSVIKNMGGSAILDYGCGDGRLLNYDEVSFDELCLFDPSERAIKLARQRWKDASNVNTVTSASHIDEGTYDIVVCSLVLMTISSKAEVRNAVSNMQSSLAESGYCIIAVTHPCFRQYHFSTFSTEYAEANEYPYLEEGSGFEVILDDPVSGKSVAFTDFHWSLSFMINLFAEENLFIEKVYELPDQPVAGSTYNSKFPGYLIFLLRTFPKT